MSNISNKEALKILQKINDFSDDEALTEFVKIVNLKGIENALNDIVDMDKKYYLKQHPYEIYYSEYDKRYRTYLPPVKEGGKRKPIASVSKENLEKRIADFYKQRENPMPDTFEKLYPAFLDYKEKETSLANAHKLNWAWETYYKDEKIVKCNFSEITVPMLKTFFLGKISEHSLTSKKYKEMKSLMNMLYDFAIDSEYLKYNVSRNIRSISYKKFSVEHEKSPSEQVYIDSEEEQLFILAVKQYEKTHNTAYLGICLNLTLGLRVGELVTLKITDFSKSLVHIQRQEIKHYEKSSNGKIVRKGYEVVPYGKSPDADRELFLTQNAKKIFSMIVEANNQQNFHSEYLLLNKKGERMNNDAINNVLRRLNKMIETPQKGNHSLRKTVISEMRKSKELTDEEIKSFAGHKDIHTTEKYYVFPTDSMENRSDAYEKAINGKIKNVFKRVQNF